MIRASLIGNEFVEVGVGEHAPRPFATMADHDVANLAGGDVRAERLGRAAELACCFGGCAQAILLICRDDGTGAAPIMLQ